MQEKLTRREFFAVTTAYSAKGVMGVRIVQAGLVSLVASAVIGCAGGGGGGDGVLHFVKIPVDAPGTVLAASQRNGYSASGDQHDNGTFVTTVGYHGQVVQPGIGLVFEVNDQPIFGQGPNGSDAADHDTVVSGDLITWMESPASPMLQAKLPLGQFATAFQRQFGQSYLRYTTRQHIR